jgi:negative regulator of sigma-B (phosphoserine phosphatase)
VSDPPPWPAALERGQAGAALAGESRSGDLAVFVPYEGGALVAAIDGLGHGDPAADAAETAAEALTRHAAAPAQRLLESCHEALRKTRGAVATLVWFDVEHGRLAWTGVGNVEGRLLRAQRIHGDRADSPVLFGGVLGWGLPTVRLTEIELAAGDTVVLATDGVTADFGSSMAPAVSAQEQAERIFASHARGNDDALVVAVRYVP